MSYPDEAVQSLISRWCVPLRLPLRNALARPLYRKLGALWTPTIWVLDHREREFRRETGYLRPADLHAVLCEGVALALAANGRGTEAEVVLDLAIAHHDGVHGPKRGDWAASLRFWRGAVGFLHTRDHAVLDQWWNQVRAIDGDGPWARRAVLDAVAIDAGHPSLVL